MNNWNDHEKVLQTQANDYWEFHQATEKQNNKQMKAKAFYWNGFPNFQNHTWVFSLVVLAKTKSVGSFLDS